MTHFGMPNAAKIAFRRTLLRLILIQVVLTTAAAIVMFLQKGMDFTLATLFGGAVGIAGALAGAWRISLATESDNAAADNNVLRMAEFYKATLFRLLTIIGGLALGMVVLELEAMGILIGFIAAQLGYFFARPLRAR
ncbi:ATP synthase subunit I [Thiohalophilus sp.]|uniref:ATP synthase subunit I n=1 Tax=Thiohalophilus sp. TaxID=3028392 RepID=UPI002ACE9C76|nr:ATP synthase subunit I [Thiohalophilus sp.]MDZ7803311.1 ATP synthase subunit I [Thiohalophilus sp.]